MGIARSPGNANLLIGSFSVTAGTEEEPIRRLLRVAAVFKFRDGKLTLWRDYWDAKTLFSQQPATWLPDIPR